MNQTQTTTQKTITFSKIDHCPICHRKLCRRTEVNGVLMVEFKHRRAVVITPEAAIKCIGCNKMYLVTANEGLTNEVNLDIYQQ